MNNRSVKIYGSLLLSISVILLVITFKNKPFELIQNPLSAILDLFRIFFPFSIPGLFFYKIGSSTEPINEKLAQSIKYGKIPAIAIAIFSVISLFVDNTGMFAVLIYTGFMIVPIALVVLICYLMSIIFFITGLRMRLRENKLSPDRNMVKIFVIILAISCLMFIFPFLIL
jgi:hypothetical protein